LCARDEGFFCGHHVTTPAVPRRETALFAAVGIVSPLVEVGSTSYRRLGVVGTRATAEASTDGAAASTRENQERATRAGAGCGGETNLSASRVRIGFSLCARRKFSPPRLPVGSMPRCSTISVREAIRFQPLCCGGIRVAPHAQARTVGFGRPIPSNEGLRFADGPGCAARVAHRRGRRWGSWTGQRRPSRGTNQGNLAARKIARHGRVGDPPAQLPGQASLPGQR
jgi:hypothetical protein